jgi:predicted nucleic-acid-binding protein
MIGLDTNILVRYLAQDDPVQSAQATHIMERRLTEARPGFISLVTMAETVWVLDPDLWLIERRDRRRARTNSRSGCLICPE